MRVWWLERARQPPDTAAAHPGLLGPARAADATGSTREHLRSVVRGRGDAVHMIGFLGVGRMGLPMCATLVRAGHTVVAHDLRPERRAQALACGCRWAATASEATAAADVLVTMLPGPYEVVEAPVGGGVTAAEDGTLKLFMGGTARRQGLHGNGQDPCPLRHGSCPGRRVRSASSP
jgi:Zn-dependent alcohol dehydrogenase